MEKVYYHNGIDGWLQDKHFRPTYPSLYYLYIILDALFVNRSNAHSTLTNNKNYVLLSQCEL
jgi:hypothetical protein